MYFIRHNLSKNHHSIKPCYIIHRVYLPHILVVIILSMFLNWKMFETEEFLDSHLQW